MLVALPTQPSFGLDPVVPLFSSPSSATSANSASKSPRSLIADNRPHPQQPNRFPLFPHPVNIAHTPTPANPFRSIVYFTVLCTQDFSRLLPSPIAPSPSHTPINPLDATLTSLPVSIDSKQLTQSLNPLNATFTENRGEGSLWLTRTRNTGVVSTRPPGLLLDVADTPDRFRAVVRNQQRPIGSDRHADRTSPDVAIVHDKAGHEIFVLAAGVSGLM